jgi:hypothetical protein
MRKSAVLLFVFISMLCVKAQTTNCTCCTDDHSAFDFWVGSWEVKLPDGRLAGENQIEKIQGGCVLRENWKSSSGNFTGTSYNFYNPGTGLWEQLWLDTSGTILKLSGSRSDDQMVLQSEEVVNPDNSVSVQRITWTLLADGNVRQVWEVLRDGVSVQVIFDGLYTRKQ